MMPLMQWITMMTILYRNGDMADTVLLTCMLITLVSEGIFVTPAKGELEQ